GDGTAAAAALKQGAPPRRIVALPGRLNGFDIYALAPTAFDRLERALGIQPVERQLSNGVRLLGASAPSSLPGQLASAWQVGPRIDPTTTIFNQLVDLDGRQWFDLDAVPLPAADWRPGDRIIEFAQAALPRAAPRQAYWWSTGMYVDNGRRVPFADGEVQIRLARIAGGAQLPAASPATHLNALFGGSIRLDGYTLANGRLTLFWRDIQPVRIDYTVFVHAISGGGRLIAQHDAQPEQGRFPTSLWQAGESVVDPIALTVPPGASLEIGLYDLQTGQRLKLADGSDHVAIEGRG
ncbi:MAG: hypothetical protein KGJ86_22315, partial [Chloroflexota bacterium]|nr:hypothetical protein [Chloroflexota bacterium]